MQRLTGCGAAWLARLIWDQEVAGSNPVTPIVMVGMAQLVSAPDCGSGGRGFESRYPPLTLSILYGSLAQLVEHSTFNPGVSGSSPE